MAERKILAIENARLLFKNFSGTESQYNRSGDRNFCVIIDPQTAEMLMADGWNVKQTRPRDEYEQGDYYIKVKVSYKFRGPNVWRIDGRRKVEMYEDTIGELDWAEIENVDLDISPSRYTIGGREGVTGYLENMWVTVRKSKFADKYDFSNEPEDVPFN